MGLIHLDAGSSSGSSTPATHITRTPERRSPTPCTTVTTSPSPHRLSPSAQLAPLAGASPRFTPFGTSSTASPSRSSRSTSRSRQPRRGSEQHTAPFDFRTHLSSQQRSSRPQTTSSRPTGSGPRRRPSDTRESSPSSERLAQYSAAQGSVAARRDSAERDEHGVGVRSDTGHARECNLGVVGPPHRRSIVGGDQRG